MILPETCIYTHGFHYGIPMIFEIYPTVHCSPSFVGQHPSVGLLHQGDQGAPARVVQLVFLAQPKPKPGDMLTTQWIGLREPLNRKLCFSRKIT